MSNTKHFATAVSILAFGALASAQTATGPAGQVTWTRDVLPIVQKSCQDCHRPGSIAPFSLLTYESARPWARSMKEDVLKKQMPPFYIDRNVGIQHFKNDNGLSDAQIQTIAKWVDGGAVKGDDKDAPAPRQFQDTVPWHIGTPDLVVSLPKDVVLPARSPDTWKDIEVDPHLTEDRWLMAVETKPTKGYRVVHHAATFIIHDDAEEQFTDGGQGAFLNEYAVGKNGDVFPEGSGRLIRAGSKINFNLHLHADGEETPLNLSLGLKFYAKGYTPKHSVQTNNIGYVTDLDLPANTDNIRSDRYFTLDKPTRVLSLQPHMHIHGKGMCLEAIYPGGGVYSDKVETLNCINNYRFGWHIVYMYPEDEQPLLPAGTVLHVVSWHNNTASNKAANDPDNCIGFGQRSTDDMSFCWVSYFNMDEAEFKQAVLDRRKQKAASTSSAGGADQ